MKAENQLLPVKSDAQRLITYRLSGLHMKRTTITKNRPHEMPNINHWVALTGLRVGCTCKMYTDVHVAKCNPQPHPSMDAFSRWCFRAQEKMS